MGKRGPAPKPTAIKQLQGTYRADRAPDNEPAPEQGVPQPPRWLSRKAKVAWRELAAELDAMQVLTLADRAAMVMLCDAYADYRELRELVQEHGRGYSFYNAQGSKVFRARPEVAMANERWSQIHKMLKEFGLTPSARTRVEAIGGGKEEDPYQAYLDGQGDRDSEILQRMKKKAAG